MSIIENVFCEKQKSIAFSFFIQTFMKSFAAFARTPSASCPRVF